MASPRVTRDLRSALRRIGVALTLVVVGALPARAMGYGVAGGKPAVQSPRLTASVDGADRPLNAPGRGGRDEARTLHDIHLTYSRVVVDGTSVLWRVRLFRDDVEKALAAQSRQAGFTVSSPGADSVFGAYFNAQVPVTANGTRLTGRVLQSGRDADVTDQEMWWYLLEFTAPIPVTTLSTRVGLLFEHFTDQRNVVTLLKMPGEERRSLYFVREDVKAQTVAF